MRIFDRSSFWFIPAKRDPHTLHRTINMTHRSLFPSGEKVRRKLAKQVTDAL
jgi:hypothetical protein